MSYNFTNLTPLLSVVVVCLHVAGPLYAETTITGKTYSNILTTNLWAESHHEAPLHRCFSLSILTSCATLFVANNTQLYTLEWRSVLTRAMPLLGITHYLIAVFRLAECTHATVHYHNIVTPTTLSIVSTCGVIILPYVCILLQFQRKYMS